LSWSYKWGSGDIIFDGSVPDSNPDPNRGDYFGTIVSYDLQARTDSYDAIHLVGTAGAISVQNPGPSDPNSECGGGDPVRCPGAALTFQLGTAAPPYDPAGWQLSLVAPLELEPAKSNKITEDIADKALAMLEIDEHGLDEMDKRILETLVHKFGGKPVGISSLAVAVGEEPDTLEEVYEPFLIQEGYLKRTPQGRVPTELAYKKLGIKAGMTVAAINVPSNYRKLLGKLPSLGELRPEEVDKEEGEQRQEECGGFPNLLAELTGSDKDLFTLGRP